MRYLIGVILAILIIIFVIVKLLTGGGSNQSSTTPQSLSNYANTGTVMRYVIDNPVQSDQTHNDIVVEVGKDTATITVTKGYQGEVVQTKSYDNNPDAYASFLLALERSGGYTQGNTDEKLRDQRGYCATGDRYSYDIVDESGKELQHYWSTSCGQKTFKGQASVVDQLFRQQIPDFDTITENVTL